MGEDEPKKLTPKEKLFIEKYLGEAHFNGTLAAELAGYKGNRNTLGVIAYQNLRKLKIKEQIDTVLEAMTMPKNVVLTRLTEISEGRITDFHDSKGNFDLELAKKRGKDHLLKKLKTKRTLKLKKTEVRDDMRQFLADDEIEDIESETEIIYEEVEFEMYSAHEALRDLGKHHKLFTDKTEISGTIQTVGMTVDEFKKQAAERLKHATETLEKFKDE